MQKGKETLRYEELYIILKADKERTLAPDIVAHFIDDHTIGIRLYHTDVITMYPDGIYELKMLFPTSKVLDTFLRYTPAKIILKELKFFILRIPDLGTKKQNLVPFFNGIKIDKSGCLYSEYRG